MHVRTSCHNYYLFAAHLLVLEEDSARLIASSLPVWLIQDTSMRRLSEKSKIELLKADDVVYMDMTFTSKLN